MRLAHDRYRVVTGGAHGMADLKWFADHLPADGRGPDRRPHLGLHHDRAVGTAGPRHPGQPHRRRRQSDAGFGFLTCRNIEVGSTAVLASRISYVGELGWELYVPMEQGARLWQQLHEAGRPHGAVPAGIGVYGTTGRIEKGYRAYGFELDGERTIVEAGMAAAQGQGGELRRPRGLPRPARGRAAGRAVHDDRGQPHHRQRRAPLHARRRADPDRRAAAPLTDGHGHHPYVTTAGSAPSLGKHVLMAYLPPDQAVLGNQLAVSYMEELYPVTVGSVDATPLFDPTNERIKG